MTEEERTEEQKAGEQTRLVFECAICENTYDSPGMCQSCKVLLKEKGG